MDEWRSYDGVAEDYDRVQSPHLSKPAADLVAMVDPPAGGRLLDVGTGTGLAAEAGLAAVGDGGLAVGIDPSLGMLAVGARRRPRVRFAGAVALDLPFRDGTFDAAVGTFVLSHFQHVDTALFDIRRVLRPGARVGFTSWSDGRDAFREAWDEIVQSVIPAEMLEPAWSAAAPGHDRFRRREALEEVLLEAGLRHVRSEQREYHFRYPREDYVTSLETFTTGRFVKGMLDTTSWEEFRARVRAAFAERFPDPLNDYRDVLFAVATRV